jgi:hypothetical protein
MNSKWYVALYSNRASSDDGGSAHRISGAAIVHKRRLFRSGPGLRRVLDETEEWGRLEVKIKRTHRPKLCPRYSKALERGYSRFIGLGGNDPEIFLSGNPRDQSLRPAVRFPVTCRDRFFELFPICSRKSSTLR